MKKLLSSMLVLTLTLGCGAPCLACAAKTASAKNKTFVKNNTNAGSDQSQGLEFKEIFKKCKDKIIDIAKTIANYKHINEILVGTVMFFLGYKACLMKFRLDNVWPFFLKPHLKDLVSHLKKIFDDDDIFDMDNFKETIKHIINDIKIILFGFKLNFKDFY